MRSSWRTASRPPRATSFGNAGGLCPSFAGPWAAPGMIGKVLKMSLQRNSAIRFSLSPEPRKLAWLARWMGQCNAERFRVNKLRMQRVAHYSFACLKEIAGAGLPIDFDFHQDGTLQLFRDEAGLKAVPGITRALDEFEVPWRFLEGPTRPASSRRWRTRARPSRARCSCRRTAPATATSSPPG